MHTFVFHNVDNSPAMAVLVKRFLVSDSMMQVVSSTE